MIEMIKEKKISRGALFYEVRVPFLKDYTVPLLRIIAFVMLMISFAIKECIYSFINR